MRFSSSTTRITAAALLGVVALLLVTATVAPASPISKKKARLRNVQSRLESVYAQSEIAVERYNQATGQLQLVEQQIAENRRQLREAERNLAAANQQLMVRARSMYKARGTGIVDVVFQADSFDELVTEIDMMKRLGNSDVDTVHKVEAYRQDIKDRRVKLVADEKAVTKLVAEREAQKNSLVAIGDKLERMTRGLKSEIKRLQQQEALRAQLALQGYSGPVPTVDPNSPGHPEIVAIARQYFGVPYVWGGASPSGFDCSGLTMYCYAKIGIGLSHGATDQQRASSPVPLSALRPGDLVFFGNASFSHHVAIFVGGTTIIEAPHSGDVVRYGSYAGRDAWIGGRF